MNVPLFPSDALAFPSYPQMPQFSTVWCSSVQCSWTLSTYRWMWNIVLQLAFFSFHILEIWKNPEHHTNRKVFLSVRKERVRVCNQMNPTFITENDSDKTTDNSTSWYNAFGTHPQDELSEKHVDFQRLNIFIWWLCRQNTFPRLVATEDSKSDSILFCYKSLFILY